MENGRCGQCGGPLQRYKTFLGWVRRCPRCNPPAR